MKKQPTISAEVIIFDLDMTLIDSVASIVSCFNHAFTANGLQPPSRDQIRALIGLTLEKMVEISLMKAGINPTHQLVDSLCISYRNRYLATAGRETGLFPDVVNVLEHFKDKRLCILTTKQGILTRKLLDDLRIQHYFNMVLGYGDYHNPKPDPEAIFKILDATKVPATKAVIIGDTTYDVLAGRNAGIHTIAVTYGIDPSDELKQAKPDFMIDSLIELKKILH